MYLLEESAAPDHATFARFRPLHFAPGAVAITTEMINFLFEIGEISGEAIFINGTKIEACANKYTLSGKRQSVRILGNSWTNWLPLWRNTRSVTDSASYTTIS